MNILPHKSWHVRTKKNIARVRQDEAKAAEEEKERQRRIALAAQEARTSYLRDRANQRLETAVTSEDVGEEVPNPIALDQVADIINKDGHVNFFQEIEDGIKQKDKTNVEHDQEKRNEQEEYEKKIGYLTYVGQNSLELTKQQPWYATISRPAPGASTQSTSAKEGPDDATGLKQVKYKDFQDPLKDIRRYLQTSGVKALGASSSKRKKVEKEHSPVPKKRERKESKSKRKSKEKKKSHKSRHKKKGKRHKKKSKSSSDSDSESAGSSSSVEDQKHSTLAHLREERLEREREESKKAERLMAKMRGEVIEEDKPKEPPPPIRMKQKYNSQFNPSLARQNFE